MKKELEIRNIFYFLFFWFLGTEEA